MLVKDIMTTNPVTVTPDTPIIEAQQLMQHNHLRHLPVVDEQGQLVGLLNRETMLQVMPWSATHLSTFETQYILSKVKVHNVMLRELITVTEAMAVEEAARTMVDHQLGCLPVVKNGLLTGLITDLDLLSVTTEMLGARLPGIRLSVLVPNRVGQMARLTATIAEVGGNLTAFGSWQTAEISEQGMIGVTLKVADVSQEKLLAALQSLTDFEVLDARETQTEADYDLLPTS